VASLVKIVRILVEGPKYLKIKNGPHISPKFSPKRDPASRRRALWLFATDESASARNFFRACLSDSGERS